MSPCLDDFGLPLSVLDPERVRNIMEVGITTHPQQERVYKFLRAGASFFVKREDDELQFALMFTDDAAGYAAMRAEVWGCDPEPVPDDERDAVLNIIRVPASVVGQPPQG